MHKRSYAVIGASYGDEGKGLITDYLARTTSPDYVIRFNGGAQAGHTVVTPDKRHVFKHLGAGTFAGIPTVLSEYFLCNPILFNAELAELRNVAPDVIVDENALVTTPFDMLVNQAIERIRGRDKHGSCGIGINETVTRSEKTAFAIRVQDLVSEQTLRFKLQLIIDQYYPQRIIQLGLNVEQAEELMTKLKSSTFTEGFIIECERFLSAVRLIDDIKDLKPTSVVFEGAQGLALDEFSKDFPHVTRSRTGLHNVLRLCHRLGINNLVPTYVTRSYLTRHGAGPFPNELLIHHGRGLKPFHQVVDQTNVENEHQGRLRFAHLDIDQVAERIKHDLKQLSLHKSVSVRPAMIAITCLDQADESMSFYHGGIVQHIWKHDLPLIMKRELGIQDSLVSEGPMADNVKAL